MVDELPPRLVSVPEACRLLGGIKKTKLYDYFYSGDLDRVKVGSRCCVSTTSIDALIDRLMRKESA